MTKAYSRFLTALFCLFLGGLLVWHVLLPDRDRSEVENRTLTQLPEFSWESLKDGSYTAAVEEYFADQFPLRDEWTGLKARTEQLLGKTLFNGVFLCGDTLISQVPAPENGDYQVILSSDDKEFGGYQNIDKSVVYHTWAHDPQMGDGFVIYLPARTAVVLRKIDK